MSQMSVNPAQSARASIVRDLSDEKQHELADTEKAVGEFMADEYIAEQEERIGCTARMQSLRAFPAVAALATELASNPSSPHIRKLALGATLELIEFGNNRNATAGHGDPEDEYAWVDDGYNRSIIAYLFGQIGNIESINFSAMDTHVRQQLKFFAKRFMLTKSSEHGVYLDMGKVYDLFEYAEQDDSHVRKCAKSWKIQVRDKGRSAAAGMAASGFRNLRFLSTLDTGDSSASSSASSVFASSGL